MTTFVSQGPLSPPVVTALRADNAWHDANGHPLAWDILSSTSGSSTDAPPPYITFALTLAQELPTARTITLRQAMVHRIG
jgi:hypothetical protein